MKLIVISAEWCRDCKSMKPIWRSLKSEYPEIEIVIIDCTFNKKLMDVYNADLVPTLILKDNIGKELRRETGLMYKDSVLEFINNS